MTRTVGRKSRSGTKSCAVEDAQDLGEDPWSLVVLGTQVNGRYERDQMVELLTGLIHSCKGVGPKANSRNLEQELKRCLGAWSLPSKTSKLPLTEIIRITD